MPYKEKDITAAERMRRYRERKGVTEGVTKQGVTGKGVTYMPDGEVIPPGRLFAPSKFLSEEEDLKVEQEVRNHLKLMSGSRRAQLLNWANAGFIPNLKKDPSLKVPEI